ncbi:MAG TPA: selenocysteine-specific translation elongation factor, partial [Steroidobacteraceae bacterium]|nr:selenocysteine-specific translation elongation factor [Steroidobacteraceae bacterium]
MIIGTAGHVDHGKTALVRALTGIDTDRLKEERLRGISIELGFAYRPVAPGLTLGFVDVPGHERFVHTMVAGAGGIDLALLVVAADDGIMPQTLEHLAILDLLGVGRGIVAVTKADRVSPGRLDEVSGAIRELLSRTPLADAPLLPVSALTGAGIEALFGELVKAAAQKSARPSDARFRLAVDRVFSLPGVGLVVTGTALSGVARVDDRLCVSPAGLAVRVRSIHAQNAQAERATAGERCALNLVGPGVSREALRRGDMILEPAV